MSCSIVCWYNILAHPWLMWHCTLCDLTDKADILHTHHTLEQMILQSVSQV